MSLLTPKQRRSASVAPRLVLAGLLVVAACSATGGDLLDDSDDEGSSGAESSGTLGSGGSGGTSLGTASGTGGAGDGCSEEAKLIYLLSDANVLYSFKPDDKIITQIGPLACATTMSPNSMAVDREAVAWVNYVQGDLFGDSAGALFKVSTADASCEPVPAVTMPSGWYRVGMGFSTDGTNTSAETLFVTGISGSGGLGRIDPATATVVPIGNFSGAFTGQNAELTGTGDGRLYGFFTSFPVEVAELGKSDASVLNSVPLADVESPTAWAFSFWGGDFYLYTASLGNSRVNRYMPSSGTVDTNYMTGLDFRIVGAGVSTCAPVEPPK